MNRETWYLLKNSKNFDIIIYRRGLLSLIISLCISGILGFLIFYVYITQPERDYYATNGVTPPIKLTPRLSANLSSQPLLEPDPPTDSEEKVIPQ